MPHTKKNNITWVIEDKPPSVIVKKEDTPVDHYLVNEQIKYILNQYYGIFTDMHNTKTLFTETPDKVCNVFSPDYSDGGKFSKQATDFGFPASMTEQAYKAWVHKHKEVNLALDILDVNECFDDRV